MKALSIIGISITSIYAVLLVMSMDYKVHYICDGQIVKIGIDPMITIIPLIVSLFFLAFSIVALVHYTKK